MSNLKLKRARDRYNKRLKQGPRGFPAATIAYYGPNDKVATKVVVSLTNDPDSELAEIRRWTSDGADLRDDAASIDRIVQLLDKWRPKSVVSPDRIIGCPHEEGVDYPEGKACPDCPFWRNIDRWTGERIE
jgi:hypothetical protein